jgi:hypothetical protein
MGSEEISGDGGAYINTPVTTGLGAYGRRGLF